MNLKVWCTGHSAIQSPGKLAGHAVPGPHSGTTGEARSTVFKKHPRSFFACCRTRTTVLQVDRAVYLEKQALDIFCLHTSRAPFLLFHLGVSMVQDDMANKASPIEASSENLI